MMTIHSQWIIFLISFMIILEISSYRLPWRSRYPLDLSLAKKKKSIPLKPEFSRIVNVAQVPPRKSVLCKILAKENERILLAERLEVPGINYFAANVTLSRKDITSIEITGTIIATIYNGELFPEDSISGEFDTIILDNSNANSIGDKISIEDAVDYDDEVGPNGEIDIGEIASQYLSLEVF